MEPTAFSVDTLTTRCKLNGTGFATTIQAGGSTRARPTSPLPTRGYASMNTANELTIVIPAKNDARLIPSLMLSLATQDYSKMPSPSASVADANSTDGTPEIALAFPAR